MSKDSAIRLLPEWAEQSAMLLCWPNAKIWRQHYQAVQSVHKAIIRTLTCHQDVILCHHDKENYQSARRILASNVPGLSRLRHYLVANNDCWVRDYGPLSVADNHALHLVDYRFNGWGNKFEHDLDDKVCQRLNSVHAFGPSKLRQRDMVLEGGSIDSDGKHTLLTTCACLLNPNRNPKFKQADIENELAATLGARRILWLENGFIAGDDTDGHIDMLARFCDANTIAYSSCSDQDDEHHTALYAMEAELRAFRNDNGQPYKLVALPIPKAIFDDNGQRLPASYCNFLIANKQVLLPVYDDPMDDFAARALQDCFPDRDIIGINCRALIHQGGSLHCATMQIARQPG